MLCAHGVLVREGRVER